MRSDAKRLQPSSLPMVTQHTAARAAWGTIIWVNTVERLKVGGNLGGTSPVPCCILCSIAMKSRITIDSRDFSGQGSFLPLGLADVQQWARAVLRLHSWRLPYTFLLIFICLLLRTIFCANESDAIGVTEKCRQSTTMVRVVGPTIDLFSFFFYSSVLHLNIWMWDFIIFHLNV